MVDAYVRFCRVSRTLARPTVSVFLTRDDIFEIVRLENRLRLEEGIEESTSWDYRLLIVRIVYTFLYSLYECYSNVKSFNLQDKLFNRLILFLLAFRSLSRLIFRLPRLS